MIYIEIKKTETGLKIEFINLVGKPISQELTTGFIQKRIENPVIKTDNYTIWDFIPELRDHLNNLYVVKPEQLEELDKWFNQPLEELLKHLDDKID